MYRNTGGTEWISVMSCLKVHNELFKIEEYSIFTDSSLPVAQLFPHASGPFAVYPSFIVHKYTGCFCNSGSVDSAFKKFITLTACNCQCYNKIVIYFSFNQYNIYIYIYACVCDILLPARIISVTLWI
jgi:hypothetical protein